MGPDRSNREPQGAGAGCPPMLATDVSRNDVVEPVVEWPPAPPTRDGHGWTPRGRTEPREDTTYRDDPSDEETVTRLAAGRAVSLLEASTEHLRTVLETSDDAASCERVERAIGNVTDASETLRRLAAPHAPASADAGPGRRSHSASSGG